MFDVVRRLWLGVTLIAAASAFLLVSDTRSRTGALPRVAILQFDSVKLLDDGVQGMLDELKERGFEADKRVTYQRFNAQDDMATANSIAKEVTSGKFDYVFTVSTNCLQAVANANVAGRVKHVFGVVADPSVAKVGVSATDPMAHPKHMVGIGSLMPADEIMKTALEFNPRLRRFGLPWNPSQANSERFTKMAREAAREMGVELIEGSVDSATVVGQVVGSLVARGADAILALGDLTVATAIDSVVAEARKGRIPVFSVMPDAVSHGALFAAGPDYYQIGRQMGALGARVMGGEDTAKIPILYEVPKRYAVNLTALKGLRDEWKISPAVMSKATTVIGR
jgi:putative tryptophan/tyrosine transport system substrate-binding protein